MRCASLPSSSSCWPGPATAESPGRGYQAPRWPDPAHPQQFHLDVSIDSFDIAEPATLALGATPLPGGGETFRVYADPQGKPFCLCLSD